MNFRRVFRVQSAGRRDRGRPRGGGGGSFASEAAAEASSAPRRAPVAPLPELAPRGDVDVDPARAPPDRAFAANLTLPTRLMAPALHRGALAAGSAASARARDVAERQHAARERARGGPARSWRGAAAPAIEAPGAEPAPASAARLRSFSARRIGRRARGGEEPAGGASAARFRPGEDAIREAGTRPGRAVQNNERERSER